MSDRHHENRRLNAFLKAITLARDTQADSSGACALGAGHDLESHDTIQRRLEGEARCPEEVVPTPEARHVRNTNALVILLLVFCGTFHLLGVWAALLRSPLPFRTYGHY